MNMLVNAILQSIFHQPPARLFVWFLVLCGLVGVLSPLLVSWTLDLLARTKKAKARIRRELNGELQRKYEGVCAEVVELRKENARLAAENTHLVGLVEMEQSHSIDFARQARTEIRAHKEATG